MVLLFILLIEIIFDNCTSMFLSWGWGWGWGWGMQGSVKRVVPQTIKPMISNASLAMPTKTAKPAPAKAAPVPTQPQPQPQPHKLFMPPSEGGPC